MRKIMAGDGLIFAGGAPRSGLTLLRAIIAGHSRLHCGPDCGILPGMALQWRNISTTLGDLHRDYFNLPPEKIRQNFATAIARIVENPLAASGKHRALEKTALNVLAFQDLAVLFPSAKFIHVLRDGRDVAASLLARQWRDPASGALFPHVTDPGAAAAYWRGLTQIGLQAEQHINDPSRFMSLRYEALVTEPEATAKRLLAFLDEPFEQGVLDIHKRKLSLTGLETESAAALAKPINTDQVGRWRRDLTKAQLDRVTKEAAPLLRMLAMI